MGLGSDIRKDLKVLYHLTLAPVKGQNHQERMESFYSGQAESYDQFRERLLKGRSELMREIPFSEGDTWLDLGGATASNLEFVADWIPRLKKVYVVDLSASLLDAAEKRIQKHGWTNVETVQADATSFRPRNEKVQVVTCSYSLTMIPDWFKAIDQAHRVLDIGGHMGVVDFYISRKHVPQGHSWFTQTFWPIWFRFDNVFLSPDHLPYLNTRFEQVRHTQSEVRLPYLPLSRVPYYQFLGQKTKDQFLSPEK